MATRVRWERSEHQGLVVWWARHDGRQLDVRRDTADVRWTVTVHLSARWRVEHDYGYDRVGDAKRACERLCNELTSVRTGRRRARRRAGGDRG